MYSFSNIAHTKHIQTYVYEEEAREACPYTRTLIQDFNNTQAHNQASVKAFLIAQNRLEEDPGRREEKKKEEEGRFLWSQSTLHVHNGISFGVCTFLEEVEPNQYKEWMVRTLHSTVRVLVVWDDEEVEEPLFFFFGADRRES